MARRTVPTATYRLLFVLVLLAHDRRRIRHVAVTAHPTAAWTAQQLREAFPWDEAPRYLVHDRDHAFDRVGTTAQAMGIEEVLTAPRAPWQNAFVERFMGSARRECFSITWSCSMKHPPAADDPLLLVPRTVPHAPVAGQGHADSSSGHATRRGCRRGDPRGGWPTSSLRTPRGLNACCRSTRTSRRVGRAGTIATTRHSSDLHLQ